MNPSLESLAAAMEESVRDAFNALERLDILAQHRAVARIDATTASILKFGGEGRALIERWFDGPDRQMQHIAAPLVYRWDAARAVAKLIDVARWAHGPKSAVIGQASIGIDAEMRLTDHFGIPFGDVRTKVLGLAREENRDVG
jgi:hypothetical protein